MQPSYIIALFAAVASAVPTAPEVQAEVAQIEKRCDNWKARKGDCSTDWSNNCYNACVSEGASKGYKKSQISSDIIRGCFNPLQSKCSCHAC